MSSGFSVLLTWQTLTEHLLPGPLPRAAGQREHGAEGSWTSGAFSRPLLGRLGHGLSCRSPFQAPPNVRSGHPVRGEEGVWGVGGLHGLPPHSASVLTLR